METLPHEFEALSVMLVLLPGFLCARIVQALCVRPKQSEADKVIESLIYSFIIYVSFVCFFGSSLPVRVEVKDEDHKKSYSIEVERKPLGELATLSVALGLLLGVNNTKDWSGSLLRKATLTQRTTRSSVWNDVFHERRGVVQVGLYDGRRVMGWAQHYSDDPMEGSLFLQNAAWINAEDELVPIDGPGILITKGCKIEYVEFLNMPPIPVATPPVSLS